MRGTLTDIVVAVTIFAGVLTAVLLIAGIVWERRTNAAIEGMRNERGDERGAVVAFDELPALPEPVARYFRYCLREGQPVIRFARFRQAGTFRAGGFDAPWSRFDAVHVGSAGHPAFVWDARIRMMPIATVRVRDTYSEERGTTTARVAGLVTVANQRGTPESAAGALQRWLAEAVWMPTALLPSNAVRWSPIDDSTAVATITDGSTMVSLDFSFDEDGRIVKAWTPTRFRDVDGVGVPTPWLCRFSDYDAIDGVRVPRTGIVAWILPEGTLEYWIGTLTDVSFER